LTIRLTPSVARYCRENRSFGPRERSTLAETVYAVLRKKLLFDHFAPSGSGPKERRMAILGFAHGVGSRDFLKGALSDQEKNWLDAVRQHPGLKDLMERHRHNLPEWLVESLSRSQLGDEFWALVESLEPAWRRWICGSTRWPTSATTCRKSSRKPAWHRAPPLTRPGDCGWKTSPI
jgi:hypothetical protein